MASDVFSSSFSSSFDPHARALMLKSETTFSASMHMSVLGARETELQPKTVVEVRADATTSVDNKTLNWTIVIDNS